MYYEQDRVEKRQLDLTTHFWVVFQGSFTTLQKIVRFDSIWCFLTWFDSNWPNLMHIDSIWCDFGAKWLHFTQLGQFDAGWLNWMLVDSIWLRLTQFDADWLNLMNSNDQIWWIVTQFDAYFTKFDAFCRTKDFSVWKKYTFFMKKISFFKISFLWKSSF